MSLGRVDERGRHYVSNAALLIGSRFQSDLAEPGQGCETLGLGLFGCLETSTSGNDILDVI